MTLPVVLSWIIWAERVGSVRIPGCRIPLFLFCTQYLLEGNHPASLSFPHLEVCTGHRVSRCPAIPRPTEQRFREIASSRHTVGWEEDPEFAKTPQCSQMTDRWSRAEKEIFNKLIEATSCGELSSWLKTVQHLIFFLETQAAALVYTICLLEGRRRGEKPCGPYSAVEILPNHMQK